MTDYVRLELIVEAPLVKSVETVFKDCAIEGWTVMPALSGSGRRGSWSRKGQIIDSSQMHVIICVLETSTLEPLRQALSPVLRDNIAFASASGCTALSFT